MVNYIFHIVKVHIGVNRLEYLPRYVACGVYRCVDTFLFTFGNHLGEKFGLYHTFAAREGNSAARSLEVRLVGENFRHHFFYGYLFADKLDAVCEADVSAFAAANTLGTVDYMLTFSGDHMVGASLKAFAAADAKIGAKLKLGLT